MRSVRHSALLLKVIVKIHAKLSFLRCAKQETVATEEQGWRGDGTSHLQQKSHIPYRSRGWEGREEAGPTSDMDARKSCSGLKMVYMPVAQPLLAPSAPD